MKAEIQKSEIGERAGTRRRISSVVRALDVFADPWTYLILREVFFRVRRFDDLQRNLQISRNSLADRLKHLLDQEILDRVQYSTRPPRYEYRLTEAGRDFYPAVVTILQWGDRWCKAAGGPPLKLLHKGCRKRLAPVVVCSHCREPLVATEVLFSDGPGAGLEDLPQGRETRQRGGDEAYLRGRPCSVARALQQIGDRWSFRILRESFLGVRRFEEILLNTGAARNILTTRLQALVDGGILRRQAYMTRPPRFDYELTKAGLDLYPSFLMFMMWGNRWRPTSRGDPLRLKHVNCGQRCTPRLICSNCNTDVRPREVEYQMRYEI